MLEAEPAGLDPREIARLGLQAAEALAHAHQRGVIHRDLKPSNLLLDPEGGLWLTDFGLARRLDEVTLTVTGMLMGTPRYMSPEQAAAAKQPIDHRTDVYSLGATLYELATGKPVFTADTPQGIVAQILLDEPVAPTRHRSGLPRDLELLFFARDELRVTRGGLDQALWEWPLPDEECDLLHIVPAGPGRPAVAALWLSCFPGRQPEQRYSWSGWYAIWPAGAYAVGPVVFKEWVERYPKRDNGTDMASRLLRVVFDEEAAPPGIMAWFPGRLRAPRDPPRPSVPGPTAHPRPPGGAGIVQEPP